MRILLDTNVFLWSIAGELSKLSARAARVLRDENNELVLSAASLWEIALRIRTGRIHLPEHSEFFHDHMAALGIRAVLAIEARHVLGVLQLPGLHRDPFDRLLVSQCRCEGLSLVSPDRILRDYPLEVIW